MADESEVLGSFKIELTAEGAEAVKKSLAEIQAGVGKLNKSLEETAKKGQGSGGSSKFFDNISKQAEKATKGLSLFQKALLDIQHTESKLATRGLSVANNFATLATTQRRATSALSRFTGKTITHSDGTVTRTGLVGASYAIGDFKRSLRAANKPSKELASAFQLLVGKSQKDPTTGKWTRTGSKDLIHSFDAVSKAALGAAKNLTKIAELKGGQGGPGGQGGVGSVQTWLEKLYKQMRGGTKSMEAMGNIVRGLNVGNTQLMNEIAGGFSTFGRIMGAFSGPLGALSGVIALGSAYVGKHNEWAADGKHLTQQRYRYKKNLDAKFVDSGKVNEQATSMRMGYVALNEDGSINSLETDKAAHNAYAKKQVDFDTSLALYNTRGYEAPWMTALANQGVDYTKIKNHDDLLNVLSKQYEKHKQGGDWGKAQWLTLLHELGGIVSAEDLEGITFSGAEAYDKDGSTKGIYKAGLNEYRRMSRDIAEKSLYTKDSLQDVHNQGATNNMVRQVMMDGSKQMYDREIETHAKNIATSLGSLEHTLNKWSANIKTIAAEFEDNVRLLDKEALKKLGFPIEEDIPTSMDEQIDKGVSKGIGGIPLLIIPPSMVNKFLKKDEANTDESYYEGEIRRFNNHSEEEIRRLDADIEEKIRRLDDTTEITDSSTEIRRLSSLSAPITFQLNYNGPQGQAQINPDFQHAIQDVTDRFAAAGTILV